MATITNPNIQPSVNNNSVGGNNMNTQMNNNQNAQPVQPQNDANLDWRNKLQPDVLEKVEESENNHFWAGTIVGAIVVGALAVMFDRR